MRLHFAAAGMLLALASAAAPAQAQNVQQMLKGLTTGNQSQDQALRDAFERGYQKGRQDEAQMHSGRGNTGGYRQGSSDNDRNYGNNNDYNRNQPSYEEQGNNSYRR